jgi:DNA polymerase III epsilon subunit-like protein
MRPCYAVIDTETTGLPQHPWAHPLSVGVLLLDEHGEEVDAAEWMVAAPSPPEPGLEASAEAIHGIPLARAQAAGMAPATSCARLTALLKEVRWIFAFNVAFEKVMLERMGVTIDRWGECVMQYAAADMKRGKPTVALSHALSHYGLAGRDTECHGALADARLTAALARAIGLLP